MVKIITDTTSCLSREVAERYSIPVIPQVVNLGEKSYLEGVELDNAAFMNWLRTSKELPKTAAPPPELFSAEFERLSASGGTVLCIHPSAEVSGTVRSATVAAQDFPNLDIRIVDTRLIGSPLGTMVEQAARWAEEGMDADTIIARLQDMTSRCRVYFLVATLEFLARGGRIGGAAALVGSMLQIKPILTVRNGRVDQFERERTQKRAVARLKQLVIEQCPCDGAGLLTIMHAGVPEEGQALADELGERLNQPVVPVYDVPPAIVTHAGPGILAAAFFVEGKS